MKAHVGLVATGLLLGAAYASIAVRSPERDALYGTIVLQLAAALLFLAAACFALGIRSVERKGAAYFTIVAFSVVFRALLVFMPPSLSTDVWRYAWEGRVQAHLENPYRLAPAAPELEPLRDSVWERVEHKEVPAVYGPVAEFSFFLLRAPGFLKIFFGLADLGVLALVARALQRRRLPSSLALLYGWHPLPIVETAGQGHLDSLGVFLLLLALDHAARERGRAAAVALGLAAGTKFLPLVLLPAFARRVGVKAAALAVLVFALTLAPYGFPRGLSVYAAEWRFNALGFAVLEEIFARPRIAFGVIVAVASVALAGASLETAAYGTIATVVAFSPVVHPWYLLWLLPFAVQRRSLAVLSVTLAIPVTYAVLLGYDGTRASWNEEVWPRLLLVGPFFALLVWENVLHGERLQRTA